MSYSISGMSKLTSAISKLNKVTIADIIDNNLKMMFNRANKAITNRSGPAGGTPVWPYEGGGELRNSKNKELTSKTEGVFGYKEDYAPHVEYGHRTVNGGYVSGQYYLKANVEIQDPIFQRQARNLIETAMK